MSPWPALPLDDTVALVPAAGSGTRLGLGPKAFLEVDGMTLLRRTVLTLASCVTRILVGAPPDRVAQAQAEVQTLAEVFPGGTTRQETVQRLLERSQEKIVVVHDVARPFASAALVRRVATAAREHQAAVSFTAPNVPVCYAKGEFVTGASAKTNILLPQTPLAFRRDVLAQAYHHALQNGIEAQSPWQLVLLVGQPLKIVAGEETNIKITTPLDWEIAQKVILPRLGDR